MSDDLQSYWSSVAGAIRGRTSGRLVAGDCDPYHVYKREKFERTVLGQLAVGDLEVLELGCGPGGNLLSLAQRQPAPRRLIGFDISDDMLELARANTAGNDVELKKTDGCHIPVPNDSADCVYTVTVLQHNISPALLNQLLDEIARVSRHTVVLVEDIGRDAVAPNATYMARPIEIYRNGMARRGFRMVAATTLRTRISRFTRRAVAHILLRGHQEGEPIRGVAAFLLKTLMPLTELLDRVVPDNSDLTTMAFEKTGVATEP